ncbi:MAG: hypothetical protein U0324_00335 [Polyangiales bacterium]
MSRALVLALALSACASIPRLPAVPRAPAPPARPAPPTLSSLGARFANGTELALLGRRATWTTRDGRAHAVDLAPAGSCEFAPWGGSVVARCGRLVRLTDAGRAVVVPGPGGDATAFLHMLGDVSFSDDGEHAAGLWPCAGEDGLSLCARDAGGAWRDLPLPALDDDAPAAWRIVRVRGAVASIERSSGASVERYVVDLDTGAFAHDDPAPAVDAPPPAVARALDGAFPCATSGDAEPSRWGGARITRAGAIRVADDGLGARWWSIAGDGAGPLDDVSRSLALLAAGAGAVVAQGAFSDARLLWLDGDRARPLDDLSTDGWYPGERQRLRDPWTWTSRADAAGLTAWVERSDAAGEVVRFGADGRVLWQRTVTTSGLRHGLARVEGRWGWALGDASGALITYTLDDAGHARPRTIAWDGRVRACDRASDPAGDEVTWAGCFGAHACLLAPGGDEQQTYALRPDGPCLAAVTAYTTLVPPDPHAATATNASRPRVEHVEAAGEGALVGFTDDGQTRTALTCRVNG